MIYNPNTSLHYYLYDNRRYITEKNEEVDVKSLCNEWKELSRSDKMFNFAKHYDLSAMEVDSLNVFIQRILEYVI